MICYQIGTMHIIPRVFHHSTSLDTCVLLSRDNSPVTCDHMCHVRAALIPWRWNDDLLAGCQAYQI